jgi:aquaporin NIP
MQISFFCLETLLTFFLMLTILNISTGAKEKGISAGIAVGSVIALEAMFAGPISDASMNLAGSLAPALVSFHPEHFWLYIVAPVLGACHGHARLSLRPRGGLLRRAKDPS